MHEGPETEFEREYSETIRATGGMPATSCRTADNLRRSMRHRPLPELRGLFPCARGRADVV